VTASTASDVSAANTGVSFTQRGKTMETRTDETGSQTRRRRQHSRRTGTSLLLSFAQLAKPPATKKASSYDVNVTEYYWTTNKEVPWEAHIRANVHTGKKFFRPQS
jgi:type VI protein secretion system component VasA